MPSFNAMAGAALTPGGVTAGLTDLVGALVNAPIKRRHIELAEAADLASRQQAEQEFAFRKQAHGDDMGLARDRLTQDDLHHQQTNRRLALGDVLQYDGRSRGGAGGFTLEDAIGKTPAYQLVPNPDKSATLPDGTPDYARQLMASGNVRQNLTPQERVAQAQQLVQAANAAGGIVPIDQVNGPATDPMAAEARRALLEIAGALGVQQQGAQDQSIASQRNHELAVTQAENPAPVVDEETATVQAWLADPQYQGYSEQELRAYYRTQAQGK